MSVHVYHELFVHLVWHTKSSLPLLSAELEAQVHHFIERRCRRARGLYLHGIGGMENHVHVAVSYAPHFSVSEIAKDLKGPSSREIGKSDNENLLAWQRGYGAVSFGKKDLGFVLEYIRNQKEHHASGDIHDRLERVTVDDDHENMNPETPVESPNEFGA